MIEDLSLSNLVLGKIAGTRVGLMRRNRYGRPQAETKREVMELARSSGLTKRRTLGELGVPR